MFDLTGKAALVTGGTSGIGLGMAMGLAEAGADVAVWGRNPEKLEAARTQLESVGGTVVALQRDVGDEEQVETGFAETLEALGRLDACFANAGIGAVRKPVIDTTYDEWREVLTVNLDGTFFTCRAAARHMVERGDGGSIVLTSSSATIMGQAGGSAYAASKGAQVAVAKALAVELARYGIRVNTLVPGWIESDLTAPAFAWKKFADAVLPRIPQRRWGTGEDFAGVAVYLASDASRYHTGDEFVIDGGYRLF
jgi:NAD(P)-dependent dehydrogenase (short-subunit alcohol dehydrogenase family)